MWYGLFSFYILSTISLHSLACHSIRAGTIFTKFLIVGMGIGAIMSAHFFILYGLELQLFSAMIAFAFICELYIFFFTFISSSISVSILLSISTKPASAEDICTSYSGKIMVSNRLRRLEDIGLLDSKQNILHITAKGQKLLFKFNILQRIFLLN